MEIETVFGLYLWMVPEVGGRRHSGAGVRVKALGEVGPATCSEGER